MVADSKGLHRKQKYIKVNFASAAEENLEAGHACLIMRPENENIICAC